MKISHDHKSSEEWFSNHIYDKHHKNAIFILTEMALLHHRESYKKFKVKNSRLFEFCYLNVPVYKGKAESANENSMDMYGSYPLYG